MFSFDTKYIHPIDQIDLHEQASAMIYSSLKSSYMEASKLQTYLNHIYSQLELEIMSSLAKDTIIKGLEDLVINLGLDAYHVQIAEEIIKRRN